jgi:anti-sigma factor RsiW
MNTHVDDVTCRQLVEVLTDYLEGVLDPQQRADIERHIVICSGCATYVEQMRTTIDLLGRVAEESPADGRAEALLGIFRAWRDERAPAPGPAGDDP